MYNWTSRPGASISIQRTVDQEDPGKSCVWANHAQTVFLLSVPNQYRPTILGIALTLYRNVYRNNL
jgi:hypothetical protein